MSDEVLSSRLSHNLEDPDRNGRAYHTIACKVSLSYTERWRSLHGRRVKDLVAIPTLSLSARTANQSASRDVRMAYAGMLDQLAALPSTSVSSSAYNTVSITIPESLLAYGIFRDNWRLPDTSPFGGWCVYVPLYFVLY